MPTISGQISIFIEEVETRRLVGFVVKISFLIGLDSVFTCLAVALQTGIGGGNCVKTMAIPLDTNLAFCLDCMNHCGCAGK